jgi:hypothetical protein
VEYEINIEEEIELSMLEDRLVNDPNFLAMLRDKQLRDTRRLGNRDGRWAQRTPKPRSIQPNTKQRIF